MKSFTQDVSPPRWLLRDDSLRLKGAKKASPKAAQKKCRIFFYFSFPIDAGSSRFSSHLFQKLVHELDGHRAFADGGGDALD